MPKKEKSKIEEFEESMKKSLKLGPPPEPEDEEKKAKKKALLIIIQKGSK